MKTLEDYSIEELKIALDRKIKEQEKIPEIIANPDFTELINMAKERINNLAHKFIIEEDSDHYYFYEEVMKTLFGKDIFTWINKQL